MEWIVAIMVLGVPGFGALVIGLGVVCWVINALDVALEKPAKKLLALIEACSRSDPQFRRLPPPQESNP
jgi:hypothetical protein